MFIYMKSGTCRELPLAICASEDGAQVILYDRQDCEIGRVNRADIDAYSLWAIAGTSPVLELAAPDAEALQAPSLERPVALIAVLGRDS